MSLLRRLERLFGRFAIPNLTLWLVAGQVMFLGFALLARFDLNRLVLVAALVREGEVWRIFTYVLNPPLAGSLTGWVFVAFAWYVFYLMGSSLESFWGDFRYNLFIFSGWALTTSVAFVTPQIPATNGFLAGTVFLAFAFLNPEFEFYLFFILPVKVKWLALITWVFYGVQFALGDWSTRLAVLAATGNFFLFFGRDIFQLGRAGRRRMEYQSERFASQNEPPQPRHVCRICGKNDLTHPQLDFRYCSKCADDSCYCPEHIFAHEHVTEVPAEK